jgi:hypothetical protein
VGKSSDPPARVWRRQGSQAHKVHNGHLTPILWAFAREPFSVAKVHHVTVSTPHTAIASHGRLRRCKGCKVARSAATMFVHVRPRPVQYLHLRTGLRAATQAPELYNRNSAIISPSYTNLPHKIRSKNLWRRTTTRTSWEG